MVVWTEWNRTHAGVNKNNSYLQLAKVGGRESARRIRRGLALIVIENRGIIYKHIVIWYGLCGLARARLYEEPKQRREAR